MTGPESEKGKAKVVRVSRLSRFSFAGRFVQTMSDRWYFSKLRPDSLSVAIDATLPTLSHSWANICWFRNLISSRRSRRKKRSISGSKSKKRCRNWVFSASSNARNNSTMVSSSSLYSSLRNSDSTIGHTVPSRLVMSKTKLYPFE